MTSSQQPRIYLSASPSHHGKLPSYVDLQVYGGKADSASATSSTANLDAEGMKHPVGQDDRRLARNKLPGVASFASLANLAALDDDATDLENGGEALGMAAWNS